LCVHRRGAEDAKKAQRNFRDFQELFSAFPLCPLRLCGEESSAAVRSEYIDGLSRLMLVAEIPISMAQWRIVGSGGAFCRSSLRSKERYGERIEQASEPGEEVTTKSVGAGCVKDRSYKMVHIIPLTNQRDIGIE